MDPMKVSADIEMPEATAEASTRSSSTPIVADPAPGEVSASFRESKICIAVDTSGSTYGATLKAEKLAIRDVCNLLSQSMDENITIIPWNHSSKHPRPLSQLDTLASGGGTDPNVVLENANCRLHLQASGFWFLMTDGMIEANVVCKFARNITHSGMHGKACIIAVFGDKATNPLSCNVSVGFSVFAVSPHVAFLYTDVRTNKTFLLATKGCFSDLLTPDTQIPKLGSTTKWDDLPQISFEDLTRISVPKAQELGKDEIALQGGGHVSISDLFAQETVDEELMREIMLNEDNLKSIALTSKARGESHKLAKWLDKVDQKLDQENEEDYDIISSGDINASTARSSAGVSYRRSIPFHMKQSAAAMRSMSRNSDSFHDPRGLSNIDHFQYTPSQREVGADGTFPPPIDYPPKISYDFLGNCSRCQKSGAKLAIVLRAPPQPTGTGDAKNLPPIGSMSKLTYPLAMGNYPEMDIIPDTIVCETCAVDMAPTATAPANVAVLPLRYYSMNRNYWIDRVDKATERRFHRSDLPPVFFGILLTKIERIATSSLVNSDLHNALRWMTDLLESDAVLQADTLQKFQSPLILSYPLDGFVAANTVLSNSGALTEEQRKPVVLLRFLYHLLENYRAYEKNNSAVQLYAAKFLILTDKPQCSQSLFEWDPWQQFCPGFKKVEELRRYLARKNIAMDRYRLSLSVADLLDTPFLSAASLADFKKLGPLFQWIEDEAGHAIAVFVHYMLRLDVGECAPDAQFKKLRERQEVEKALADPKALSVEVVRRSIEPLPAL